MTPDTMTVPARWTDDCQGKKDYDGHLVTLSTRYWPRGGGFHILGGEFRELTSSADAFPGTPPSAKATIYLGSTDDDYYDDAELLIEQEFEAETQEEVQHAVEVWAHEQYARIAAALRREFAAPTSRGAADA